jgi:hypothetical protein
MSLLFALVDAVGTGRFIALCWVMGFSLTCLGFYICGGWHWFADPGPGLDDWDDTPIYRD